MSDAPPPLPPLPLSALEPHVRQLAAIAELLLGAAQSDGKVSWSERSAIAGVLASFVGEPALPEEVEKRLQTFEFRTFDLGGAVAALTLKTAEDRKDLLALVARVTDADAVLKIGERSYLTRVAKAIGASDEELAPFIAEDKRKKR